MTAANWELQIVFWCCALLVAFAYLGYPLLILACSRLFGRAAVRPACDDEQLPTVSLLIAAHNEEDCIEARLLNALSMDYPADKFEVVIASDGSTDATNQIVRRYGFRSVRLLDYPNNRGKAVVLDESVVECRGDIILFSDANTHMEPDAARRLAAWFADRSVGVACGRLILRDAVTGKNVDGVYWKYETFLKKCESRLGALLGSNGAIYAMRRAIFPGIRPGTLIDDFVIPLEARKNTGCRIIYDAQAVATEETSPDLRCEFRRRARIGAGGFQSIGRLAGLLNPTHGWIALTFLCHKLLRWVCPFLMIGAAVSNLLLLPDPIYIVTLLLQVAFYAFALFGDYLPTQPKALRILRLPTMFVSMNAALLVGFVFWVMGKYNGTWKRTDRATAPVLSSKLSASEIAL